MGGSCTVYLRACVQSALLANSSRSLSPSRLASSLCRGAYAAGLTLHPALDKEASRRAKYGGELSLYFRKAAAKCRLTGVCARSVAALCLDEPSIKQCASRARFISFYEDAQK